MKCSEVFEIGREMDDRLIISHQDEEIEEVKERMHIRLWVVAVGSGQRK